MYIAIYFIEFVFANLDYLSALGGVKGEEPSKVGTVGEFLSPSFFSSWINSILSKTEESVDFCAATTVRVIEVITKDMPNAQVTFPRALILGLPVIPPPPPPPPMPSPPPSDL